VKEVVTYGGGRGDDVEHDGTCCGARGVMS
jgi:hypothetical protein